MEAKKKIVIVGAGPGGLTSAMILAHKGYEVIVIEKEATPGGRNSCYKIGDFTFDIGPTFAMRPEVFTETFAEAGEDMKKYLDMVLLDPMYRLRYGDGRDFFVSFNKNKLKKEIKRVFPGEEKNYDKYLSDHKIKFDRLYKCLTVPYLHWYNYMRLKLLNALPILGLGTSVHDQLSRYFKDEDLKIAMAFQAKYLGMSPWKCPGGFSILSYVEHAEGVYHFAGGLHKISEAMAKVATKLGAKITYNQEVKQILFSGKKAIGVKLSNGEDLIADAVIVNADFAHAMSNLVKPVNRKKYTNEDLKSRAYSCSTFMIYLGIDKKYDIPHHNIFFSSDYRNNTEEIYETLQLSKDPSFYIQNACATDSSLAPKGKSTIYVLVPVPNLTSHIDWNKEKQSFRDLIIKMIEEKTELKDISKHIEVEKIVTPLDWENKHNVYNGAVFNLAHSLDQMLYLRPRNRLEGYEGLYIVGGGTHPGSGLPTILESGRISARLIQKDIV